MDGLESLLGRDVDERERHGRQRGVQLGAHWEVTATIVPARSYTATPRAEDPKRSTMRWI